MSGISHCRGFEAITVERKTDGREEMIISPDTNFRQIERPLKSDYHQ